MQSCLCVNLIRLFMQMFYRHNFDIMMKYICLILYAFLFRNIHLLTFFIAKSIVLITFVK
jgi:hypothetical protein